jgi:hypothetical protein
MYPLANFTLFIASQLHRKRHSKFRISIHKNSIQKNRSWETRPTEAYGRMKIRGRYQLYHSACVCLCELVSGCTKDICGREPTSSVSIWESTLENMARLISRFRPGEVVRRANATRILGPYPGDIDWEIVERRILWDKMNGCLPYRSMSFISNSVSSASLEVGTTAISSREPALTQAYVLECSTQNTRNNREQQTVMSNCIMPLISFPADSYAAAIACDPSSPHWKFKWWITQRSIPRV